ncbi:restriction endonuclease subunit S [Bifidobacterium bifidum]|uniref:restriction endonuclease subunit S n=1 Tax=Bifidobacterium bifidum TaxID=1681 RepID=UPI000BBF3D20|nr:restriction endonuclease S subunit [Bifidobacterium bifidum]
MTEQAKVPAIRFAGFTDPWEQRKASEVFQIVDDRGHPTLPVLSATQNQGMIYRDDSGRYIGHDESNEIGYKRVLPGDFVVHLRSFQGGFAHSQYEGITSPAYTVFRAKEPTSHSDRFWKHWFMSEHFIAGLSTVTYGIRDGRSISVDEFMNTFLAFPAVEEQAAISRLFDYLDDLITLHQRKYDKLVVFKKSMLEKMFPKDGESVPEIRFAGFTDPWEQRKLGELEKDATLYMGRGRVISAKDMSNTPGTFPVYSSSALDNGRMGAYGKYMFNQELITWSIDGGGAVFYRRKHRFSVTNVSGYIAVNPEKINCKFLAYTMSLAHSRIKFDYTVKAHPSVIRSLYTMGIPISLQEQQVIGSFFSRLDNLITLHQRKLELLRNIKKSLLDKMFV